MTLKQDEAKFVQEVADLVSKSANKEAAARAIGDSATADKLESEMTTKLLEKKQAEKKLVNNLQAEMAALKNGLKGEQEKTMTDEAKKAGKVILAAEDKVKQELFV